MANEYSITIKRNFLVDVKKLPAKESHQINNKLELLAQDPTPDAKVKKQLKYMHGGRKLHRIRSGNYRIFYTFDQQYISILALRRRDDDTYEDELDAEFLGGLPVDAAEEMPSKHTWQNSQQPDWEASQSQVELLPEPITIELLSKLKVPVAYHNRLLRINDRDTLINCPGVDDDTKVLIDNYMFETPIEEVVEQPDLVLYSVEDLWRYREGELLTFLLKLSPEQDRLVRRAVSTGGPMLVKGGPGSGKSTVALYRVQVLLEALRNKGIMQPRILFTTYTNALVNSSRQQLSQLLGENMRYVTVQTADSLISRVLGMLKQRKDLLDDKESQQLLSEAIKEARFEGNPLQQQMQRRMLEKLGSDYLLEELLEVIEARQLHNLQAYLDAPRHGRRIRLSKLHRKVIWSIYEGYRRLVMASGKENWQMQRARAADLVVQSSDYQSYDAVIIDEAQDLNPSALRFLVQLCKSSNHLFLTADANQSIYGGGFNWSDVHASLNFKGRTGMLDTNYRSTKEIGEAAHSYLSNESLLDTEIVDHFYVHEGPLPIIYRLRNHEQEVQSLAHLLRMAASNLHQPLGSCTVLCPDARTGQRMEHALHEQNLEATFMKGNDLDLSRSGIKILTLNSSKGLEFPIVALAGFSGSMYAAAIDEDAEEEQEELLARQRRTLFVGMTRAMRALLVILPEDTDSPLMQGFQARYWQSRS